MEVWIRQGMDYRPFSDRPTPFPVPGSLWNRDLGVSLYDERMKYIRRMDELGFDGIVFTEHHYDPNGGLTPSPNLMIAAAAQITQRIKLVTLGLILPLHAHPVRVAEELAMLDNLSHGRIVAGFVSGNVQSLYAYSMPAQEGRARHREAYELIRRAWAEENAFPWEGQFFRYECVSILPRPYQKPHPPVWTVAGSADSIEWAADNHVGVISSGTVNSATEILDYYQNYAESRCGWAPTAKDRGIHREIYLGRTRAEVERAVAEVILPDRVDAYKKSFDLPRLRELKRDKYTPHSYAYRSTRVEDRQARTGQSVEEMQERGQYLVGDPDSIIEQILRQHAHCNAEVLVIRPEMGGLNMTQVTAMMELFAKEVLPVLRKS